MAVALVPRMAGIGARQSAWFPEEPARPAGWLQRPRSRRVAGILASLVVVIVGLGATVQALNGAQLQVAPSVTPWAREHPLATPTEVAMRTPMQTAIGSPTATPSPSPTPGPFAMDLYEKGDYAREFRDTWCVPAAMQTSMNIMDVGADVSEATQTRLWTYARSLVPDREGGAEPEAWALGPDQAAGTAAIEVSIQPTLRGRHPARRQAGPAHESARRAPGLEGRPLPGSSPGSTSTRDPALTDAFTVTAVRIEDVWYPRLSSIWGYSNPPDTLVPVSKLPEDFLPWRLLRDYPHPDKDGKFVIVIPVEG